MSSHATSMLRPSRIVVIFLFAILLGLADRVAARAQRPQRDSVSVLLFANHPSSSIAISARALTVDGARYPGGGTAHLRAVADGVILRGAPVSEAVRLDADGVVTLVAAKRSRRVRGTIEVRAADGMLRVVAVMSLRDYLLSTLPAEGTERDPLSYLAALAVLQRNYALSHRGRHAPEADLCDNTHCQLADMRSTHRVFARAVDEAGGMELTAGSARPCYYSANCGGGTIMPARIWRRQEAGYSSVDCSFCHGSRWYRWMRVIASTPAVEQLMGAHPPAPFVDDDFKIHVGRLLGFSVMPSNTIDKVERRGRTWMISGRGFGHRVGLCQDGARELARRGMSADAILRYYFPAATVAGRTGRN